MTFYDLAKSLGATPVVDKFANLWTRAMLGKESNEVSALYCLMYFKAGGSFMTMRSDSKGGGQHLRFRQGTQSLSKGLAAALTPGSLFLSHPVARIEQTASGPCVVTTASGKHFFGSKVIVSVPTPLYKTIAFSPPLSDDKREVVTQTSLGFYAKAHVVYSTPWWRERGLNGLTQAMNGPISITRDTSSDADGVYALTCFIVGANGEKWSRLAAAERKALVLKNLDSIYGTQCPEPTAYVDKEWRSEKYSQGCPCPVVPNEAMEAWERDQWKPEGNFFFVGTETSPVWRGYMEGALESGERGAKEALAAFATESTPRAKL